MGHTRDANELLEIPGDELRPIVGDDPRFRFRIFFSRSLQNDFDFCFGHRFSQIPMDDRTAIAIQNAAQVVEGATHVAVGNIDVPVLMRMRRLLETGPLARRLGLPSREQPGSLQDSPHAGRAYGHHVRIQHHERQSSISFQWIVAMEPDDRLLLPRLQPEITGDPTVVFVDAPSRQS